MNIAVLMAIAPAKGAANSPTNKVESIVMITRFCAINSEDPNMIRRKIYQLVKAVIIFLLIKELFVAVKKFLNKSVKLPILSLVCSFNSSNLRVFRILCQLTKS